MRVAVFGAGGVGGFFGGKLARSGVDVCFISRGAHLEALRASGLRVASVHGDFELAPVVATSSPAEAGQVDYVLVTVKGYHTEQVAAGLGPLLHENTVVISLQNGIDNEEKLAATAGPGGVAGGAAYIFAQVTQPGVVEHTGGPAAIVVGEWSGQRSGRLDSFVGACQSAGFKAEQSSDIRATLWTKFAFICAVAGTTAAIRLPIGKILTAPASRELFHKVAAEVCEVAGAEGISLPADLPERHLALADSVEAGSYSSLYHDLDRNGPTELEALLGEVTRRGARAGVSVPMSEALYAVLQPWDLRLTRSNDTT